jgi:two-component system CheB/CheR fusion protein
VSDSYATTMDLSEQPETANTPPERAEFLVVGLGASAGGLQALEEFFDEVPEDAGMAFVVITHLAPGRVSLLPELIARHSRLPVLSIEGETELLPNHVYVQPSGVTIGILNGKLHVFEPPEDGPRPLPIDFFFRCLAQDQKERAVGIVLSGTGTDGTNGLKEVKAAAGLTMAQDEHTARYPGMPHSARAAVDLDYVLPPREMARELVLYARGPAKRVVASREPVESAEILSRIFVLLRNRTGHDFSHYKTTTTGRRIARRMNVHQLESSKDYLRYVQVNPQELDLLFRDLLIGVTSFFRDPDAFDALVGLGFRSMLNDKPDGYVVRCWVAGCSTGEEAYSLAMLLREFMDQASVHVGVQIFATDLDPESVDQARAAVYPLSISSDVSPKRLERFFVEEDGHYRIKKEIREMLVFAIQDVVEDPPFTKLDLIVCRNLLIYLNADVQKRLIPIFHYSLKPGGILFLGSSETVGGFAPLFEPLDKKWKLFKRKEVPAGTYVTDVSHAFGTDVAAGREPGPPAPARRVEPGMAQLLERALLQQLVPPTVVMHQTGEIVHIQGRTGLYLEPASGPQGPANVFSMAREGLQLELTLAVRQAASTLEEVVHRGVRVRTNGDFSRIDLHVKQLVAPDALRGLLMVSFVPARPDDAVASPTPEGAAAEPERVHELERELRQAKEVHESTIEELETANEELKSANEELQSMNEELQSANEELETSKEEMQSLNEELQTVNAELQGKVEALSRANDDMKNLLNATDIATIFLDNKLNIKRYTEQAKRVIRLIPTDISRPIGDLASNLRYSTLTEDAREVLRTLVFKETEIQGEDGSWYLMRILPYRTTDNVIDGLVVTFVNVTKVRGLLEQTRRLLTALSSSATGVCAQDRELRYEWAFGSIFGRWPNEVNGRTDRELLSEADALALLSLKRGVLDNGKPAHERMRLSPQGHPNLYDVSLTPIKEGEVVVGVTSVVTELTGEGRT